jgi:guanosine-3',5'-bis(diphosphate) 3'-pyrophosphohydrolase
VADVTLLLNAMNFAAQKHRSQKRKGAEGEPYINHPVAVAQLLSQVGGVTDAILLCGAILHDTIEDTTATEAEVRELFGDEIATLVMEVSDDKSLPKEERKRLQVDHAEHKSERARLLKIADKTANLEDLIRSPPLGWSTERVSTYFEWANRVVSRLRGINPALDARFDAAYSRRSEIEESR